MRICLFLCLMCLSACDIPHPFSDFAGVPASKHTVGGATYSVRVVGDRAQAVRTSFDLTAGANRVDPRAGLAMERASGCKVLQGSLQGDSAMVEGRLICS